MSQSDHGCWLSLEKALDFNIIQKKNWFEILFVSGYDWASLGDLNSPEDLCTGQSQCDNGGICYPLTSASVGNPATQCVCPPRYTGARCSEVATRCAENPCQHGGTCTDLEDGFVCTCEGTGYSGTWCHLEDNSCAGQTCNNGATCLGEKQKILPCYFILNHDHFNFNLFYDWSAATNTKLSMFIAATIPSQHLTRFLMIIYYEHF